MGVRVFRSDVRQDLGRDERPKFVVLERIDLLGVLLEVAGHLEGVQEAVIARGVQHHRARRVGAGERRVSIVAR